MLVVPSPVVYGYLTGLVMEVAVHERRLITRIAEMEFNLLTLSAFFGLVCNGLVRWLSYKGMMVGCHSYGSLVWVSISMVEKWFGLGIMSLVRNMEVDPVLPLVTVARVVEVDWAASPD